MAIYYPLRGRIPRECVSLTPRAGLIYTENLDIICTENNISKYTRVIRRLVQSKKALLEAFSLERNNFKNFP